MKKSMKKYNVKFSYLQSQILVIDSVLAGKEMSLLPIRENCCGRNCYIHDFCCTTVYCKFKWVF